MQVTTFSPLFRHAIGLERFNDLFESMAQSSKAASDAYPPYNIEKRGENEYRITMAVAGFKPSELSIVAQDDELHITGTTAVAEQDKTEYLYKGIATRNFQRKFRLTDFIKVVGANIADGLLTIELLREVPEARKPRTIEITQGAPVSGATHVIENAAA
jgi:molecular chaperone IbpA